MELSYIGGEGVTFTPAWTVTTAPLSCPACGLPLLEVNYHETVHRFRVTCPRCGCVGPVALTAELAVIKWNRMESPPRAVCGPKF